MVAKTQAQLIVNYVNFCAPFVKRPVEKQKLLLQSLANKLKLVLVKNRTYSEIEEFYCYIYLDPRYPATYHKEYSYTLPSGKVVTFTHKPFYVGKGKSYRLVGHLSESKKETKKYKNSYKNNIINKLYRLGLKPIIKPTASLVTEATALAFEINLIAGIGRHTTKTGPLTNVTHGGEGCSGVVYTKKDRAAISAKSKATYDAKTEEEKQHIKFKMSIAAASKTVEEKENTESKKAASREIRTSKEVKIFSKKQKDKWSKRTVESRENAVTKRLETIGLKNKAKNKLPITEKTIEYFEY